MLSLLIERDRENTHQAEEPRTMDRKIVQDFFRPNRRDRFLRDCCVTPSLVNSMARAKLLDFDVELLLKVSDKSDAEKTSCLVDHLAKKSRPDFERFLRCMSEARHPFAEEVTKEWSVYISQPPPSYANLYPKPIWGNLARLQEILNPEIVDDYLISYGFLNTDEHEKVMSCGPRHKKTEFLLSLLERKVRTRKLDEDQVKTRLETAMAETGCAYGIPYLYPK